MKKRILLLCLFCMTLGFAYSQEPDPQITNMTKVVICTSDKKSLIKAESLKEIWKPAYIHTISISPKANLKALIRLEELLQKTPMLYNPENTLIICTDPSLGSSESMIVEGKITPLTKEDNEPGYDFKFVEEKAL